MFTVEVRLHTKDWRNGDLEDKMELVEVKNFKTRKEAKDYIEYKLPKRGDVHRFYHKGDKPSVCYYYTGVTWQHENTGEQMEEYYQYTLRKGKAH